MTWATHKLLALVRGLNLAKTPVCEKCLFGVHMPSSFTKVCTIKRETERDRGNPCSSFKKSLKICWVCRIVFVLWWRPTLLEEGRSIKVALGILYWPVRIYELQHVRAPKRWLQLWVCLVRQRHWAHQISLALAFRILKPRMRCGISPSPANTAGSHQLGVVSVSFWHRFSCLPSWWSDVHRSSVWGLEKPKIHIDRGLLIRQDGATAPAWPAWRNPLWHWPCGEMHCLAEG